MRYFWQQTRKKLLRFEKFAKKTVISLISIRHVKNARNFQKIVELQERHWYGSIEETRESKKGVKIISSPKSVRVRVVFRVEINKSPKKTFLGSLRIIIIGLPLLFQPGTVRANQL